MIALRPPKAPLSDGTICLRLPSASDAVALAQYATSPRGLDGAWLPVQPGSSYEQLGWIIDDWRRGWKGIKSRNGPALLLRVRGIAPFVGYVSFNARDNGVVELVYGIAPDWRNQGLGTRGAILATGWLAGTPRVTTVELRVGRENRASQRVAEKAGFRPAGTVTQFIAATGAWYEDLRYVYDVPGKA